MNWLLEIEKINRTVKNNFSELSAEELNMKPEKNTWSIAQNLNHLIVVNETYFPVLASLKTGTYKTPFIAKIGFLVSFLGKLVLGAVQPDRKKKMKTFRIWEPGDSGIGTDILQRFEKHQLELSQKIKDAEELIAQGVVISSPANRNIVYKLETAFDIIITHELRHLEQAKEVLSLLKK